jgi:DNA-binding MarR family transcriptional regulator
MMRRLGCARNHVAYSKRMTKPPVSYALDRTFTHRLHTLNKLTDRVSQAAYLQHTGLPLSEGRCLSAIGAFTPLSVNDLAHRANLNKGQASRAAQSLVEQGLVRKAPSPTDGRGVVLTLTPQGERAYQQVVAVVQQRNADILACLSAAEQRQLDALLERLVDHARLALAPDDDTEP